MATACPTHVCVLPCDIGLLSLFTSQSPVHSLWRLLLPSSHGEYRLIISTIIQKLRSQRRQSKKFKDSTTSRLLPSIRRIESEATPTRHGSYGSMWKHWLCNSTALGSSTMPIPSSLASHVQCAPSQDSRTGMTSRSRHLVKRYRSAGQGEGRQCARYGRDC